MAEKSRPEFILEIVKTFIWPTLIIMAVLWLGNDVKEILKSRTWKIGIIEVGDRISNLQGTLQDELLVQKDYLNRILAGSEDTDKVREYARNAIESIENAQKGVKKEIQNIRESIPEGLTSTESTVAPTVSRKETIQEKPNTAKGWESLGFQYLLSRQIEPAIEAFTQAEKTWPDYHNVSEIRRLLIQNREMLMRENSTAWKEVYQKLTSRFSWGMPSGVRQEMQKYIADQ